MRLTVHQWLAAFRRPLLGWGPAILALVSAVRAERLKRNSESASEQHPCWQVGAEFAGAEAPIFALKELGMPFKHAFSSEYDEPKRQFIVANRCAPQGPFYRDMLTRDHARIPWTTLYVAGFPCTPFSSLRNHSKLMKEAAAKQFLSLIHI